MAMKDQGKSGGPKGWEVGLVGEWTGDGRISEQGRAQVKAAVGSSKAISRGNAQTERCGSSEMACRE